MSSDDGLLPDRHRKSPPLGYAAVLAIIFFDVAGGPFGVEDAVRYGGPGMALLGLLLLPVVWGIPEALMTAELATMFPDDSGSVAWVTAAFGPFWGFQEGWISWISGVIDNSIYPLFLARYLTWFLPILEHTLPLKYHPVQLGLSNGGRRVFFVVSSVGMTYINYRGLKVVGRTAVGLMVFILCPFVVLAGMGIRDVEPANWFSRSDDKERDMVAFLNVMFWNLNYWDSVASLSGEIGNIGVVLPRALLTGVALVCLTYLVPVLVGIGVWGAHDWPEGFFAQLGNRIGGVWMEGWITLSAVASQIGLFTAELSSDAYLVLGLADKGVLPKVLAHRSHYGTPTYALLLSGSGVIATVVSFNFVSIVEMLNVAYCFAELLEFLALLHLRQRMPDFPRPFKIPLGIRGLCLMLLPSVICVFVILVAPFVTLEWTIMAFSLLCWGSGVAMYYLLKHARRKGLLCFNADQLLDGSGYLRLSQASEVVDPPTTSAVDISQLT